MPWVRIDDAFYDHSKWVGADPCEIGVWVTLIAWSNRNQTDGSVPKGLPARLGAGPELIASMVAREILEDGGDEYRIHDYLEWQRSAAQIQELAEKRAEAGRRGGEAKARAQQPASKPLANVNQKKESQEETPPNAARPSVDDDFEDWWKAWPKKVEKSEARAKYRARRKTETHARLCQARDNYLAANRDADLRFIKHGASFLGPDWADWLNGSPLAAAGRRGPTIYDVHTT